MLLRHDVQFTGKKCSELR